MHQPSRVAARPKDQAAADAPAAGGPAGGGRRRGPGLLRGCEPSHGRHVPQLLVQVQLPQLRPAVPTGLQGPDRQERQVEAQPDQRPASARLRGEPAQAPGRPRRAQLHHAGRDSLPPGAHRLALSAVQLVPARVR